MDRMIKTEKPKKKPMINMKNNNANAIINQSKIQLMAQAPRPGTCG